MAQCTKLNYNIFILFGAVWKLLTIKTCNTKRCRNADGSFLIPECKERACKRLLDEARFITNTKVEQEVHIGTQTLHLLAKVRLLNNKK